MTIPIISKLFSKDKVETIDEKDLEDVDRVETKTFNGSTTLFSDRNAAPKILGQEKAFNEYNGIIFGACSMLANSVASSHLNLYTISESDSKIANFKTHELKSWEAKALSKENKAIGSRMHEGDKVDKIFGHPSTELLVKANNYQDGYNLLKLIQIELDLVGNAFVYVVKDKSGTPVELHLLNPLQIKIVPNQEQTEIDGYLYNNGKANIPFSTDEILKFSNPNPYNRFIGLGTVMASASSLSINKMQNQHEFSTLKNGGVVPFILKYAGGDLTKDEIRVLQAQMQKAISTPKNSGKAPIIDGEFEIEKIALTLEELMFTESKKSNLKDLFFNFGIPYSLYDSTEQKKAGLNQIDYLYATNAIMPRLRMIEQVLTQQYLPMFDDSGDLFFTFDSPIKEDEEKRANIINSYVASGILSVEEARERLGM